MSKWPTARLPDVAEIIMGQSPPGDTYNETGDGLPFFQGKTEFGEVSPTPRKWCNAPNKIALAGDILMSVRAPVGPTNLATTRCCIGRGLAAIRANQETLDPAYLRFVLRHAEPKLASMGQGSTFAAIGRSELASTSFPLPPLPEQRRIVDILSRAEGIVRLRREAEKKAAELIPAIFLDMFGDPATNPKGCPMRKISDFVAKFEGGKNIQAGSENGSAYRILKVSAATSGVYRESESKPAPDGYNPPASHIVRAGDMLFSRANTVELVGATAIVDRTDGKTLLPDKLWRFVWAEPVDPAYMHALFQTPYSRRELGKLSSGTSASMRNISQAKLFGLPLPVAPYDKQKEFGDRAVAVRSIQSQQAVATARAEATFAALLAQVFSGNA